MKILLICFIETTLMLQLLFSQNNYLPNKERGNYNEDAPRRNIISDQKVTFSELKAKSLKNNTVEISCNIRFRYASSNISSGLDGEEFNIHAYKYCIFIELTDEKGNQLHYIYENYYPSRDNELFHLKKTIPLDGAIIHSGNNKLNVLAKLYNIDERIGTIKKDSIRFNHFQKPAYYTYFSLNYLRVSYDCPVDAGKIFHRTPDVYWKLYVNNKHQYTSNFKQDVRYASSGNYYCQGEKVNNIRIDVWDDDDGDDDFISRISINPLLLNKQVYFTKPPRYIDSINLSYFEYKLEPADIEVIGNDRFRNNNVTFNKVNLSIHAPFKQKGLYYLSDAISGRKLIDPLKVDSVYSIISPAIEGINKQLVVRMIKDGNIVSNYKSLVQKPENINDVEYIFNMVDTVYCDSENDALSGVYITGIMRYNNYYKNSTCTFSFKGDSIDLTSPAFKKKYFINTLTTYRIQELHSYFIPYYKLTNSGKKVAQLEVEAKKEKNSVLFGRADTIFSPDFMLDTFTIKLLDFNAPIKYRKNLFSITLMRGCDTIYQEKFIRPKEMKIKFRKELINLVSNERDKVSVRLLMNKKIKNGFSDSELIMKNTLTLNTRKDLLIDPDLKKLSLKISVVKSLSDIN